MRTEDIVGVGFFGLLITGIVVMVSGFKTAPTPRQRARRQGLGLGLISFALLAFGLVSFQLIHSSPQPVVEGNLRDVRHSFHGGAQFMITHRAGRAVQIQCTYNGSGLVEGERARVRYVEYNRKLIALDMLGGSYQAWHLRETSGENGCWGWVCAGMVCGFFAYRQLAKIRQEQPTEQ